MAGIGFELRRILQQDTFSAMARAYLIGGVVVLGPFLCSILCIAGLTLFSAGIADTDNRQAFAGAVVWVFGGSLIVTGLVQVVLTRYLADQVYRGDHGSLAQSVFPVILISAALLGIVGVPVLLVVQLSWMARTLILTLGIAIGVLWMLVVFVSSSHRHWYVVMTFLVGTTVALVAGLVLLRVFSLEGLLFGYTAGHVLMLFMLVHKLIADYGYPEQWDWGVLRYLKRFPLLIAIGVLQSLGVWIDKFLFWGSDLALNASGLVTAPKYDSSTFLGFLTALPALVHFFVRIEADFSERFHEYYDTVFFRSSFEEIHVAATALRNEVIRALLDILKVQGMVTFLCVYFAVDILDALGLPVSQVGLFRFAVVASLFLAFMLFSNVIMLYLDRQKEVFTVVTLFCATNLVLTLLSLRLGYQFYGLGFAAACFVGVVASLFNLANQLYNLEYVTFAPTPLSGQRRARPGLRARPGGGYGRYNPIGNSPEKVT